MFTGKQVKRYSSQIGLDPLLIQGAGGNVSWKDGGTLWIKASGTWLSDADDQDIFIPLDLHKTQALIAAGAESLVAAQLGEAKLRPSIETSLHALLPQKVVVHYHAVEVIAHAVQQEAQAILQDKLSGLAWQYIPYAKPGPELARKVAALVSADQVPEILVLGNHGLVIAGDSVATVDALLQTVLQRCSSKVRQLPDVADSVLSELAQEWAATEYMLPSQKQLHQLAADHFIAALARRHWVMYPDHAIFLQGHAIFLGQEQTPADFVRENAELPACVLIDGRGIVVSRDFSASQYAMLSCYLDVARRLDDLETINSLNDAKIAELLNWDAEKYRQRLNNM